jgi:hypothetical protein
LAWAAAFFALISAGAARADDCYYVLVFGSQLPEPDPNYSHSWATFVRASGNAPTCVIESHTISWLPRTLEVHLRKLHPEPGVNLELRPTIVWALDNHMRISLWGPYQVDRDLYCRSRRQFALLESGRVRYKAMDAGSESDRVSNCIHAVTSMTGGYRVRVLSPGWGETASFYIARRMQPWIIDPSRRHDWLLTALGLDGDPLIRRDLVNPRTGAVWSAVRAVGGRGGSAGRGILAPAGSPAEPGRTNGPAG